MKVKKVLSVILVMSMIIALFGGVTINKTHAYSNGSYWVKPAYSATSLYVIDVSNMTDAEKTMIATLQGIVANKTSTQIYVTDTAGKAGYEEDAYTRYLNDLQANYGVTYQTVTSAWTLVDTFKSYINGYILYQTGNSSINAANSLAGIQDAIAVEAGIENTAKSHGLNMVLDVKTRDEEWVKTNYWNQLNHGLVIEAKESIAMHLRDYATLAKALIFFDGNSSFRSSIMGSLDPDSVVMGWGDVQGSEETFIADSSYNGVLTIPADWGRNLSVLSGINVTGPLAQNTHADPVTEENVHYVCFYVSDGDNLQWTINRGNDSHWWGSTSRGAYKLGWTIPPCFVDLVPSVAKWYYNTASSGKDNFIVGPSGMGFIYPEAYPAAELDLHTERLNDYMAKTDTRVVGVIGRGSFNNTGVWNKYTSKSNIDGIFYYAWSPYFGNPNSREIVWSNGKPVIGTTYKLADGLSYAQNKTTVLNGLNSASTNPHSASGYSLVAIDAWNNYDLPATVKYIVDRLNSNVRVVTPEEFVKLIKTNLFTPTPTPMPTPTTPNIALNKTATANAQITGEEAPKAVDGSTSTKWCTNVSGDKWLKLDLGQNYDIDRWIVRHAGAGGENTSWNTRDFKLQKSSDGTNWTDADTVTGNTASVTDRTVTTFASRYVRLYITAPTQTSDTAARIYEFELYGPDGGATPTPTPIVTPTPTPITTPTPTPTPTPGGSYPTVSADSSYEWIAGVSVGSLNNTSGSNNGYGDFTSITTDMSKGTALNVSLMPGFSSSSYTEYWKIWIDLNQDYDFDDSGEEVFSSNGSDSTVTGTLTIPASALNGATRMRVVMKYDSAPTSSGSIGYGEAEDYTVNIQ